MAGLESPYADYKVLDLNSAGSRRRLLEFILPPGDTSSGAPHGVLDNLFGHASLRTAIFESEYIDVDHSRSYSQFYSRSFLDHSKRTTRVHFFTRRLTRPNLVDLVQHQDDYLGYVVVRPLRIRTIGRTVLRPPASPPGRYHFATASIGSRVNLAGNFLVANGCPFMEQDARVSACASASIWMATSPTTKRFELRPQTTAGITELATSIDVGARRVQSDGLRPDQMSTALSRMGYEPIQILELPNQSSARAIVYAYTESAVAPVLLLQLLSGYHTTACIGHSYNPSTTPAAPIAYPWTGSTPLRFWRSWQWVDSFIVHDDQMGPYRPLRFLSDMELQAHISSNLPGRTPADLGTDKWSCPVEISHAYDNAPGGHPSGLPKSTIANLTGMIIPSPSRVSLSAEEAERKVAMIIGIWANTWNYSLPDNLCLRTYLATSNDFKARLASSPSLHPDIRQLYLGKGFPHWLWVTEVGLVNESATGDPKQSRIRGEILIDASSSPWLPDFVALHLPTLRGTAPTGAGILSTMRHGDKDVSLSISRGWSIPDDHPYERFTRPWS